MDSLKNLLNGMLHRHQITAQVTTARVIEVANDRLAEILPPGRYADAGAVLLREGTLVIHCRNAAAAGFLATKETDILDAIKRTLPTARVDRIRTKIGV